MTKLSHQANINTVAIQTNLSCSIDWITDADLGSIAFWTTYHPGETPTEKFIEKIHQLERMGARYSVGVVGMHEHFDDIEMLRNALPENAYIWVNAYKRVENYYTPEQVEQLVRVDPLFELNNQVYPSKGRACYAGEKAISVLADGTARRCHFIDTKIGNIYEDGFEQSLYVTSRALLRVAGVISGIAI